MRHFPERRAPWRRRDLLKTLAALGVGTLAFREALASAADGAVRVTSRMVRHAEWLSGLELTRDERDLMLEDLTEALQDYGKLRAVELDNAVPPALDFHAAPLEIAARGTAPGSAVLAETTPAARPSDDKELAFAEVRLLASLLRARKVSSVELTRLYLERLERFDPALHCVISPTRELALAQAEQADRRLAAGEQTGPLHGIPWGLKDLFSVPGYRTTWGATPYKDQVLETKATIVERLERAGAPLLAKLSVGALAWGDVWFDEMTRNPWNLEQGSSGSSAGSASAVAAGLVGFAIGTETWGSIVSPCTRCGATGLRPTFGRVSRHGGMALSWSMDKVGPIARSADDCAWVFDAIRGADGRDPTAVDRPFTWPPLLDVRSLRVGFVASMFEEDRSEGVEDEEVAKSLREWQEFDRRTLDELRALGVELVPVELPRTYPVESLSLILTAEASAAFDELTRSGRDDELVRQVRYAWPNVLRQGQLIPAVEYIRANRIRTLVMREMDAFVQDLDVYITPSFGGNNLLLTNLTGHPAVVLPNGFRTSDGTPTSITFMGKLFGEGAILSLARAYQESTEYHRRRPSLDSQDS